MPQNKPVNLKEMIVPPIQYLSISSPGHCQNIIKAFLPRKGQILQTTQNMAVSRLVALSGPHRHQCKRLSSTRGQTPPENFQPSSSRSQPQQSSFYNGLIQGEAQQASPNQPESFQGIFITELETDSSFSYVKNYFT